MRHMIPVCGRDLDRASSNYMYDCWAVHSQWFWSHAELDFNNFDISVHIDSNHPIKNIIHALSSTIPMSCACAYDHYQAKSSDFFGGYQSSLNSTRMCLHTYKLQTLNLILAKMMSQSRVAHDCHAWKLSFHSQRLARGGIYHSGIPIYVTEPTWKEIYRIISCIWCWWITAAICTIITTDIEYYYCIHAHPFMSIQTYPMTHTQKSPHPPVCTVMFTLRSKTHT